LLLLLHYKATEVMHTIAMACLHHRRWPLLRDNANFRMYGQIWESAADYWLTTARKFTQWPYSISVPNFYV